MVKVIVFCTKFIVTVLVALLFASCGSNVFNGIKGNGNVQTEKRNIAEKFTKISVNRGIEVVVEQSDAVMVEVEADQNLLSHITTKVENGTLVVSSDENIYSAEVEIVHVKMPVIEGLETTSGSNIKSKGVLKSASDVTNIRVASSSGSEIEANLEFDSINAESTSGSTITLSGKALKIRTATSSGSTINAQSLIANEVAAEATSGSSNDVHAAVKLVAKASSGASIDYSGAPKNISKEETSGGSVSSN
jgi:hypothetical protein